MTGDSQIVARVVSITNTAGWAKAGVMMREQLTANSRHAFALVSAGAGLAFQRRLAAGDVSTSSASIGGGAPTWVKLARSGSTFTASRSADGVNWTSMGSDTIAMPTTIYVGLAVTSHNSGAATTAALTNVAVSQSAANQAPSVNLTSPAGGAVYTAGSSVTLNATASDPDGSVARVEFYHGATLIDSDTDSPYSATWSNLTAGTFAITARAYDNLGLMATSSTVSLTVTAVATAAKTLQFTPSSDDSTNVTGYRLDLFAAGANPATATPTQSSGLGKPGIVSGLMAVDITPVVESLPSGSYFATVTAIGPGGSTRSTASATFVH
jgi:hypothetical protein